MSEAIVGGRPDDGQLYDGFDAGTTEEERSFQFPLGGLRDTDDDGTLEATDVLTPRELRRYDVTNVADVGSPVGE